MTDKPTYSSLSLIQSETDKKTGEHLLFPAFTTKFDKDDIIKEFGKAEVAQMDFEPVSKSKVTVKLTYGTSDPQLSDDFNTGSIEHTAKTKSVEDFNNHLSTATCFIWILSTPSFEGRALIDVLNNSVVKKELTQRILH